VQDDALLVLVFDACRDFAIDDFLEDRFHDMPTEHTEYTEGNPISVCSGHSVGIKGRAIAGGDCLGYARKDNHETPKRHQSEKRILLFV
jgi:hypothetical protein